MVESFHTVYFLLDVSNYVIYKAKLGAALKLKTVPSLRPLRFFAEIGTRALQK